MLTQANLDPRAWTADTIDNRAAWYHLLPPSCLKVGENACHAHASLKDRDVLNDLAQSLLPIRRDLETGRGFAIVQGPRLDADNAKLLYWIVSHGLGRPFEQNVQGTLLYDVRDLKQDVSQGARFSLTNYESSFHTDNSFGTDILDYVGLLCLQNARSGGRSQLLSGHALVHELRQRRPEVLATLCEPFHVDRRGGTRPGETATIQFPILQWPDGELLVRYLRYWIEAGHAKTARPLTPAQVTALDVLDEMMRLPYLRIEFDLQPGEMYFINNRWTLHNRTAFEDHSEPDRRRHLVRIWLQRTASP